MTFSGGSLALVVTRIADIAPDVRRFTLADARGQPLPGFSPGAHIAVTIGDGPNPFRRAYSLTGSPDDRLSYEISVLRQPDGRGGSRHLHEGVAVGDCLRAEPPVNHFPIDRTAKTHLFIAGGIGITPFLQMAHQLGRERQDFELHVATRSQAQAGLAEDLAGTFPARVTRYVGETGRRLAVRDILARRPLGTHAYVCGPARLIAAVQEAARDLGWPPSSLHVERFQYRAAGEPFSVALSRSGRIIRVEGHQTMLEALESAGIETPALCRVGACGRCRTAVEACDGQLIHNDQVLDAAERSSGTAVIPCVSRFAGRRLVLDL